MSDVRRYIIAMGSGSDDGHIRVTRGEEFFINGGSEECHSTIRDKVLAFNKYLEKKGLSLDNATDEEINQAVSYAGFQNFKKITLDHIVK